MEERSPEEQFEYEVRKGLHMPRHWPMSYSSLESYDACALQYKLNRLEGLPRTGHPMAVAGDDFHARMKARYDGVAPEPDKSPLSAWAAVAEFKGMADRMVLDTDGLVGTEVVREWTWDVEGPHDWQVVTVHFQAKIDRLHIWPDGRAKIVDYKTGQVVPKKVDDDPQALTYCVATYEHDPSLWEWTFEQPQIRYGVIPPPAVFTLDQVLAFRKVLKAKCQEVVLQTEWKPNPGSHCWLCPYSLNGCTAGGKLVTDFGPLIDEESAQEYAKLWVMLDTQKGKVAGALKSWMARNPGPIQIESGSYQISPVESYSVPPDKVPEALDLIAEFSGQPLGEVAETHLGLKDVADYVKKIPELKAMATMRAYGRAGFVKAPKRPMKTHAMPKATLS